MDCSIAPIVNEDRQAIMDIFNHYVENSYAAYPEKKLPYEAFEMLLQRSGDLPTGALRDGAGNIVGFGMLRPHSPAPTFSHTAEVTYFLHPSHRRKGLGRRLLSYFEKWAAENGISNFLVHISSLNSASMRFHQKNGFVECGRFLKVGKKQGKEFDTVWMQKILK